MTQPSNTIANAVDRLRHGAMVLVADSADRENEVDIVMPASAMSTARMAFFLRYGSGIVCTPMSDERADQLGLPLMVAHNTDPHTTAFTVSVDHVQTGTGISARDRAVTAQALAASDATAAEFRRPGHVFPLRARPGGVASRAGHTEASLELLALAGVEHAVAAITELVDEQGVPVRYADGLRFAEQHDLPLVCVEDLLGDCVVRSGEARIPLSGETFRAVCYRSAVSRVEHVALVLGDVTASGRSGVLVRVHSECLTGDVFGSRRCDCGEQLRQALALIAAEGSGVLVYLRGQEGRGIGLGNKLRAYSLQERGYDTVEANAALGLPVDSRDYGAGAAILADLGVDRFRLITNNPEKCRQLADHPDLTFVGRVSMPSVSNDHNAAYLAAKRDRLGHALELSTDTSGNAQTVSAVGDIMRRCGTPL